MAQAPNWAAAAAAVVGRAALGECGMTVVHSRILEWHMADVAGGCTGYLRVVVWKREGLHMAEKKGQSSREHYMGRVQDDGEGGGGAAAVADGCSGSS